MRFLRWFGPGARLLTAFIALALVLFALTFNDVRGILKNGSNVQVAGKLRLDAQRTFRWLAESASTSADGAAGARGELQRNLASVAQLIDVLVQGGTAAIAPGNEVTIQPEQLTAATRKAAQDLKTAWQPISDRITPLLNGTAVPDRQTVQEAARAVASSISVCASALPTGRASVAIAARNPCIASRRSIMVLFLGYEMPGRWRRGRLTAATLNAWTFWPQASPSAPAARPTQRTSDGSSPARTDAVR